MTLRNDVKMTVVDLRWFRERLFSNKPLKNEESHEYRIDLTVDLNGIPFKSIEKRVWRPLATSMADRDVIVKTGTRPTNSHTIQ